MVNHYFWVFPEEIHIWIGGLSKAHGSPQCGWASPNTLRAYIELKCRGRLNLSAWLQSCDIIFSRPQPSWFPGLQTQAGLYIISSMTLRLLNSITGFPESPACRRSFMGFLSLYNCVSQFLIIYLSICLPTCLPPSLLPSYWFCFWGEQMRWVQLLPCSLRRQVLALDHFTCPVL